MVDKTRPLYRCYIDESGDEGLTPSSRPFFFVTGVIFEDAERAPLNSTLDVIKQRVWQANYVASNPRGLHWNKLKHPQRVVCIRELAKHPINVVSVGIWKPKLKYLKKREQMYNMAIRYLIERVSWLVDDKHGYVKITFSDRSNLDINTIRAFLTTISSATDSQLRPVFDPNDVSVVKATKQPMLEIADACSGAIANAFNHDQYGETHPYFLYDICQRLYRSNTGKLIGYGIKIFPDREFLFHQGSEFKFVNVLEHIA